MTPLRRHHCAGDTLRRHEWYTLAVIRKIASRIRSQMRRLLDSSYLMAVERCLDRQAVSITDVETLVRFVGEVLVADALLHTADETGPVYEAVMDAASRINRIGGDARLLRHFSHQSMNYPQICQQAAEAFAKELRFIRADSLVEPVPGFEPRFATGVANPDLSLVEILEQLRLGRLPRRPLFIAPSTAPLSIVSNPVVRKGLVELLERGFHVGDTNVLALAATMRMVLYAQMGEDLIADYLPATARARLHTLPERPEHPDTADLVVQGMSGGKKTGESPLSRAIDAAVGLANGSPEALLRLAFELRHTTSDCRPLFRLGIPRDGCLEKDNRMARQLEEALAVRLHDNDAPSLLRGLEPRIFLIGPVPGILLKLESLGEWLQWKLRERQTTAVAEFIGRARKRDTRAAYERLAIGAGLPPR